MNEDHIKQIKEILVQWNPLGKQAAQIPDLNNYDTEAIDIIFNIEMELEMANNSDLKKTTRKMTKEVLNEAFNIELTDKDCEKASELIYRVLC